jgi:hypothetical protein
MVAPELAVASEFRVDRVEPLLLGAKRSFRMGVAGWRFAHTKRTLVGRATVVAALEDWQLICSVVVATGSMTMIGIMLWQ